MIIVLSVASGAIAAAPFVRLARREVIAARLRLLGGGPSAVETDRSRAHGHWFRPPAAMGSIGRVLRAPRARRQRLRREAAIGRELPVVVDLVGVALAAGCTPYLAIEHAARYGPSRTARALHDVMQACALGQSLDDALRDLGATTPTLRPLSDALRTSARLGSPAAAVLARLAVEVRADVRRRAEARARTIPVRLCFPLVACVLPAFALLTVAPVVLGGLHP